MIKILRIEFKFSKDEWARISRFYSEESIRYLVWVHGQRGLLGELGFQERFSPKKATAGEKSLTKSHRRRNR